MMVGLSRSAPELFMVLIVAGALSAVALAATIGALTKTREDLFWLRHLGIGNGRLAHAIGEHRLAWVRLGQAVAGVTVTGTMAWVASQVSPEADIPLIWTVIIAMIAAWSGLVATASYFSWRTRRRVDLLGLDENGDKNGTARNGPDPRHP